MNSCFVVPVSSICPIVIGQMEDTAGISKPYGGEAAQKTTGVSAGWQAPRRAASNFSVMGLDVEKLGNLVHWDTETTAAKFARVSSSALRICLIR
jgi:hypothetical protein